MKDLLDQAKKFLHNFHSNVNVALNHEPTVFNLDVSNYLKNQDKNIKNPSWNKGTTLVIGDSILSGLREYKISTQKTIKIRIFLGVTLANMKFSIILHLRKSPHQIFLRVGTNDAPQATSDGTPQEMFNAIKDSKSFIQKYAPESNMIISTPVLRVDKANANDINKRYTDLLKEAKVDYIFNNNIAEFNIDQYGSHINESGSIILAKNLISGIRNFWTKRLTILTLNDSTINSSKHGYSSKYLKSDSNITDIFTHEEHHRDTITDHGDIILNRFKDSPH